MCGRFTMAQSLEEVEERFDVPAPESPPDVAQHNIAPTQTVAVVTEERTGQRALQTFRWGLVPSWTKDLSKLPLMHNARAETVAEKPSFRNALALRRCLIPATGFYEWQAAEGTSKTKIPYRLALKNGELFAFAGLWEEWLEPGGSALRSCTIITTTPNAVAARIHDRMPVILRPEDEALWLDPRETDTASLMSLLTPYPASKMDAYEVSRDLNTKIVHGEKAAPLNPA